MGVAVKYIYICRGEWHAFLYCSGLLPFVGDIRFKILFLGGIGKGSRVGRL